MADNTSRDLSSQLEAIIATINDGIITIDAKGVICTFNPAAERMFGYAAVEVVGRNIGTLTPEADHSHRDEYLPRDLSSSEREMIEAGREVEGVRKDGSRFPLDLAVSEMEVGGERMFTVVVRDLTARKLAERQKTAMLAQLNALKRALDEHSIVAITDVRGKITYANDKFCAVSKYSRSELLGQDHRILSSGHHSKEFIRSLWTTIARGATWRGELKNRAKDGSFYWVETTIVPLAGPDGKPVQYVAIRTEITERKAADDAAEDLRGILENASDFIIFADRNKIIRYCNRVEPPHTPEQVVGSNWLEYFTPEQRPELGRIFDSVVDSGQPANCEASVPEPDGTSRSYACHLGRIIRDPASPGVVIIARDVTDTRRTEAQLIQSERMASVGILAAGVAHEINNPLAAVIANLDLASREVSELTKRFALSSDLGDELRDARDCAERIRVIVRDLRIFSRSEQDARGPVDTKRVLESMLRMVWNEVRHRARLVEQYGEVPPVEANEARLGQIFLNLITNAAQAIPEGRADQNEIRISTRLGEVGFVIIEIADTGAGMSPEVQRQIFTPFFTTKPAGVGTGLGLAICLRLVEEMGGRLEVESELGKGTRFRLHARAARSEEEPVIPEMVSARGERRGAILVIDDEPVIGKAIRRSLCAEHEVSATNSARKALERIKAGERFDAILCDLMMPDLTGMDLHAELSKCAPEQAERMIFMTGGAFTTDAQEFLDRVPNLRFDKPFDRRQLLALINERIR